jgi:hypothetical protein
VSYSWACQVLATGWTVRGSNSVGARFSEPVQTGPRIHLASCTMGTTQLLGVVQTGPGTHLASCTMGTLQLLGVVQTGPRTHLAYCTTAGRSPDRS